MRRGRAEPAGRRGAGNGVAALLRPLIPRALLDGPGWDRVLAAVRALPDAGLGAFLGCEFRLGAETPAADLFVVVRRGSRIARHYIRKGKAAPPRSPAAALGRHLAAVGKSGSVLHRRVAGTMLEYDLAEPPEPAGPEPAGLEPGVFLKIRPAAADERRRPQRLPITALADAVGWTDAGQEQRAVARALAALPPRARIAHVGALPGRTPRAVRVVAQEIGRGELAGALERLGRRGAIDPAAAILSGMETVLPRFRLAVDVAAAGLLPRVGVELYHAGSWSTGRDGWLATGAHDWRPVTERLAQRGWCLPGKAHGLLEWCALDKMFDRRGVFLVYKGINHVKLTITDAGVDAKAYAGMTFCPAPTGPLKAAAGDARADAAGPHGAVE